MRNRITLLFLLSFFLMIFSCKKNDEEPISDISGCMDTTACNYDVTATLYDNSCTFPGCTDSLASNYNPLAGCDDSSCIFIIYGCTDSTALNYNPAATVDDGSCEFPSPYDFAQGTWFFESVGNILAIDELESQLTNINVFPEA